MYILSVCLSACLPVCLPVCLSVCLFACRLLCMSACMSVWVCLSVPFCACLCPSVAACLSVCLSVRPSVHPSIRLNVIVVSVNITVRRDVGFALSCLSVDCRDQKLESQWHGTNLGSGLNRIHIPMDGGRVDQPGPISGGRLNQPRLGISQLQGPVDGGMIRLHHPNLKDNIRGGNRLENHWARTGARISYPLMCMT